MTIKELLEVVRLVFGPVRWRTAGPEGAWRAAIIQEGNLKLKVSIFPCGERQIVKLHLMERGKHLGRFTVLTITFCETDDSWSTEAGNGFRTEDEYERHLRQLLQTNELARRLKTFGENSRAWEWMRTKGQDKGWFPQRAAFATLMRSFALPPPWQTPRLS